MPPEPRRDDYDDIDDYSDAPPPPVVDVKTVRKFREQMHALGGLWIIIGLFVWGLLGAAIFVENARFKEVVGENTVLIAVVGTLASVWIVLGVCTCLKMIWAVYVALGLSYFALIGNILSFRVCGVIMMVVVILQAHRVITWASQLRRAGVPLTTKPESMAKKKLAEDEET